MLITAVYLSNATRSFFKRALRQWRSSWCASLEVFFKSPRGLLTSQRSDGAFWKIAWGEWHGIFDVCRNICIMYRSELGTFDSKYWGFEFYGHQLCTFPGLQKVQRCWQHKVGWVFSMVIWPESRMRQCRDNDREGALHTLFNSVEGRKRTFGIR